MNNYEKRLLLEYLKKVLPKIDVRSSSFEEFFEEFISVFRVSKKRISEFYDDGIKFAIPNARQKIKKEFAHIVSDYIDKIKPKQAIMEDKISYIKEIYKLDDRDTEILTIFILKKTSKLFAEFTEMFSRYGHFPAEELLSLRPAVIESAYDNLYYKKLIDSRRKDAELTDFWFKVIDSRKYNSKNAIINAVMGRKLEPKLKINNYEHIKNQAQTAINILKSSVEEKAHGINILLYGKPGTGKTEFAKLMAKMANVSMYGVITHINKFEEAHREDRLIDLCTKQYALSSAKACILFDEAEDVLNTGFSFFNTTASKGHLNHILETTSVPVIWTTNNIKGVDSAFLRRMTYTIEFEELSESARFNIWDKELKKNKFKVEKSKVEKLNKTYNISTSIITNAIKTAKMIGGDENIFEELIENVATVVEKKKNIKKQDGFNPEKYNIGLVNADLDMDNLTDKIIQSRKLNFSLCLYGEPGTGKSEYAKYLANRLGIEVIYKKASDLISMWVGQTEQNIAKAFEEAKIKHAMLIFDEADSFLQNRSNAQRSWEVTQVNEMLTWMESHQYPFICTTNLINTLDEASLRRFTFKVKFDFMKPEQVNFAIEHFFDIKNSNLNIKGLTTGDFAVVKKKVDFLGIKDINEISKMLSDEVKVKKSPNLKNAVGF